jgi:hypothetical protein
MNKPQTAESQHNLKSHSKHESNIRSRDVQIKNVSQT